jgi:hypothetical protein
MGLSAVRFRLSAKKQVGLWQDRWHLGATLPFSVALT